MHPLRIQHSFVTHNCASELHVIQAKSSALALSPISDTSCCINDNTSIGADSCEANYVLKCWSAERD